MSILSFFDQMLLNKKNNFWTLLYIEHTFLYMYLKDTYFCIWKTRGDNNIGYHYFAI